MHLGATSLLKAEVKHRQVEPTNADVHSPIIDLQDQCLSATPGTADRHWPRARNHGSCQIPGLVLEASGLPHQRRWRDAENPFCKYSHRPHLARFMCEEQCQGSWRTAFPQIAPDSIRPVAHRFHAPDSATKKSPQHSVKESSEDSAEEKFEQCLHACHLRDLDGTA